MAESIRVVAKLTAQREKISEFRDFLLAIATESKKERGCRSYDVLQSTRDASVFVLVEEWDSLAALEEHNEAPHVRNALGKAPSLLAAAPEIERYRAVG